MLRRLLPLSLICTLSMAGVARSTTVIPPTFEYLVANAGAIFVGEAMDVRARWIATAQGRGIMTDVTFKVEEVWKGRLGGVTQLEFLGGTIDGVTMEVVGMPTFKVVLPIDRFALASTSISSLSTVDPIKVSAPIRAGPPCACCPCLV